MKFGKVESLQGIDFQLPPDAPSNVQHITAGTPAGKRPQIYIGCTGWSMKEWVGKVYPRGTKSADFLLAYAKQFNTIELNTTHYRTPSPDMVQKWRQQTPADFRFCPKILQRISHSRDLGTQGTQLHTFINAIAALEDKYGCAFLQLPPYFGSDRRALLLRFADNWPSALPLAIELRHASWFEAPDTMEQLAYELQRRNLSLVLTDVAGRRDVLHMHLSNRTVMVRFVGNGLHPSDYSRIDEWVTRLQRWMEQGVDTIYFFPHEPDNVLAPELSAYLYKHLRELPGIDVRGPKLLDEEAQGQISLF